MRKWINSSILCHRVRQPQPVGKSGKMNSDKIRDLFAKYNVPLV